jgi:hypothetical protein
MVDQLCRAPRVDLLPKSIDDHIHDIGAGVEVIIPRVFSDQCPGHHVARVPHEVFEHGVLFRRHFDELTAAADLMCAGIELEIAHR